MATITAIRYHDISTGHVVHGHESKCAHLHGHNYRIYFTIASDELDAVGRVMDFSVIKQKLCLWLEEEWDHKFLIWSKHEIAHLLYSLDIRGVVLTPFNPTAENMALYLLEEVAPAVLAGTGCRLTHVRVEETRKCSAEVHL
ncbi:COG0720 6-pyruvoyl-tetrahydropterin synthase [uncultured Caudovirales phage]|uniref:COG0720 6-pyruvoyl-tetrahydropterin synthase n=1 Tax=uncultured Caudovirales phage TaxID=2100421 RepID=A0A6J5P1S1_9CAUD|nr:COG0720 6-pyruvoyl-tetrahydropterin synthase [uncultured Caudovirales phage]